MSDQAISLDLVLTMIEGGMSIQEIAEELDTADDALYAAIRRVYPGLLDKIRNERDEQIATMYSLQDPPDSGNYIHSSMEILAHFGIATSTLYTALGRTGTPRRRARDADTSDRDAGIVHDYNAEYPVQDICLRHGVSQGTMYKVLRQAGVQLRRAGWENSQTLTVIEYGESPALKGLFNPNLTKPPESE